MSPEQQGQQIANAVVESLRQTIGNLSVENALLRANLDAAQRELKEARDREEAAPATNKRPASTPRRKKKT